MPGFRMIASRLNSTDERGAILVMAAVWMVSALAFVIFVVDLGHWFEHKRHLQLQADAGAFAGGGFFNGCVAATAAQRADPASAANIGIENMARKFSGDRNTIATALNPQVSNRANVTVLLNSTKYANQAGATNNSDPAGPPCQAKFLDVKATDATLPWFFKSHVVPAINAHARVSSMQVTTLSGTLPVAVQDVNPLEVAALFVNESNPDVVIASKKLTNRGAQNLNGKTMIEWDNIGSPVGVDIQGVNNGVILALSGIASWSLTSNSVSTICAQVFVTCYAINGASYSGLLFIHGYQASGGLPTPAAPILRDVSLYNQSCTDSSGPYFLLNGGCTVGVHAKIDFGCPLLCAGNQLPAGAQVKVDRLGCPNSGANPKGCPMSYSSSTGYWDTSGQYPTIPNANSGTVVTLNWGTTAGGNNSFTQVARPFSASDDSGPIQYAQVTEGGTSAQSLTTGVTHNLSVAVGIGGNLANASSGSDPTVILRFASGAASNSGGLDCDSAYNSDHEFQYGCETAYTLNPGLACTAAITPPYCIPVQTGNFVGPLRSGMNARFAGCPANNWVPPAGGGLPTIQDGDPRLIPLIITSYGAFAHNGNTRVPVQNFGAFYVTGWDQGSGSVPCTETGPPGNQPFPGTGSSNGDIWGHFYKYVGTFPGYTTGGVTCDFSAFGLCTVQLTQ
jgi:hypothetical protein